MWEVLNCDDSSTKFIISDHAVTTYNKGVLEQRWFQPELRVLEPDV